MTNPDNIVRVRARNGGRASVYEANGWAQAYTSGLLEGNGVTQNTSADMNVLVGGSATKPDVVLAENPAGYKIALDLVGQQAVAITAPTSNSRISSIVAYTDDLSLATTQNTVTGSPASCGLIVVNGTAASTPIAPNDTQIRSAITADGATGSQAAYCVIAEITVANGTTAITNSEIDINLAQITADKIDFATMKRWVPDYTNRSSTNLFSSGTTATIVETGFVHVFWEGYHATTAVEAKITVNGADVLHVLGENTNANGARTSSMTGLIPVASGDIVDLVSITTTGTSRKGLYFIPGKWV